MRAVDLLTTIAAGAAGAALATLLVGASLMLALPAALGIGAVTILAGRTRR